MKLFLVALAVAAVAHGKTLEETCKPQFESKFDCIQAQMDTRVGDVSSRELDDMFECIQDEMTECIDASSKSSGNAGGLGGILALLQPGAKQTSEEKMPELQHLMDSVEEAKECMADKLPQLRERMGECLDDELPDFDLDLFVNNERNHKRQLRVLRTANMAVKLSTNLKCPKILTCAPNKKTFRNLVNTVCTYTNGCDRRVRTASCKLFEKSLKKKMCECAEDIAYDIRRDAKVDMETTMVDCLYEHLPSNAGNDVRDCARDTVDDDEFENRVCQSDMTDPIDAICQDDEEEHIFLQMTKCMLEKQPSSSGGLGGLGDLGSLFGGKTGGIGGLSSLAGNGGGLGSLTSLAGNGGGLGSLSSLGGGGGGLSSFGSLLGRKK